MESLPPPTEGRLFAVPTQTPQAAWERYVEALFVLVEGGCSKKHVLDRLEDAVTRPGLE